MSASTQDLGRWVGARSCEPCAWAPREEILTNWRGGPEEVMSGAGADPGLLIWVWEVGSRATAWEACRLGGWRGVSTRQAVRVCLPRA